MNSKIHSNRIKPRFQPMGLIFYCYLLIPLNELALNVLKINKLKIRKKIIDISMVSIQDAGKGIFNYELQITNYGDTPLTSARSCHSDGPLFRGESGLCEIESMVTLWSLIFCLSIIVKNSVSSKLACSFPCYRLIPLNELVINALRINKIKITKKIPCYIRRIRPVCSESRFCHLDERRDLIEAWLMSLKSDVSSEGSRGQYDKRQWESHLERVSFNYQSSVSLMKFVIFNSKFVIQSTRQFFRYSNSLSLDIISVTIY
jgi:hypothetical protein